MNVEILLESQKCIKCIKNNGVNRCRGCNDLICNSPYCGLEFPHKNNELFVVCKKCQNYILNKFKVYKEEKYPEIRFIKTHKKLRLQKIEGKYEIIEDSYKLIPIII